MIRKKGLLPVFLALGLSALFTQWVMADDHGTGPCAGDVKKFCADAKSHEAVGKCLAEHANEVSEGCKASHEKRKAEMNGMREACKEDHDKHCKDVQPGQGRVLKCLMAHMEELNEGCKKTLTDIKSKHQGGGKKRKG